MATNVLKNRVAFTIMSLLLLLVGCQGGERPRKVSLSQRLMETATTRNLPAGEPLRMAVAAIISPDTTMSTYDQLLSYLGEKLGRPVRLEQRSTYAETNDLVRVGSVELAFVCTYAYILGHQEFGMELLVVPQVGGQTVYHSYIIVPYDSDAQGLEGLRGKVFAFADPLSNSGRLAPTYMLAQRGETPESFFGRYIFTYGHDKSIEAVAEGLVDGAAVDSLVYDYIAAQNPQHARRTRIIEVSPPYGIPPVVVPPGLDAQLKEEIRQALLEMHLDPEGKAILSHLMIDRFVTGSDDMYDSVRDMAAALGDPR